MKDLNRFQLIVLAVFLVAGIAGVVVVATSHYGGSNKGTGRAFASPVVVWGTLDRGSMDAVLTHLQTDLGENFFDVSYVQKNDTTFESELVEAIASGVGPDLVLLPQDAILKEKNKLFITPYASFSERTFRDQYVDEGELYLSPGGIFAFPFSINPLVMYWNRDLFASAAQASPPRYWDEFYTLSPLITKRDLAGNVARSAVALGEYVNVSHAKELLSALMRQAGNPLVTTEGGKAHSVLLEKRGLASLPVEAAVRFYVDFSDPVKPFYSWNRSLASSKEAFISGDLATYFGFAGEIDELRGKNPNLNFDLALLPQTRDANTKTTFGKLYGIAILKGTKNLQDAFFTATTLAGKNGVQYWIDSTNLPPVRRDLLGVKPTDAYKPVFYDSAVMARAWLDPDPLQTEGIFRRMVESSGSGKARISEAVDRANSELTELFK